MSPQCSKPSTGFPLHLENNLNLWSLTDINAGPSLTYRLLTLSPWLLLCLDAGWACSHLPLPVFLTHFDHFIPLIWTPDPLFSFKSLLKCQPRILPNHKIIPLSFPIPLPYFTYLPNTLLLMTYLIFISPVEYKLNSMRPGTLCFIYHNDPMLNEVSGPW